MRASPTVTWRAYAVVALGTPAYTLLMFSWFSLPAYLPVVIADLGLTGTQAGVLAGAVPLTYVPLALLSGLAIDRIGPGWGIAAGVAIYGLAQAARSVAPGFPSLLAATLALGVGATAITFGLPKLVSVCFPPDRTGTPSAIYLVGASAGTAGAFAVGRPVLGPLLGGWRPLFLWSGVGALCYGVVWLAGVRLAADRLGVVDHDPPADATFTADSLAGDVRAVFAHRELRLLVVVGTVYLMCAHGLQGWLPAVLESRGLAADRAGQATSLLVAATVVGVLGVPPVADRLGVRRGALMVCGALAFAGVGGVIAGGAGPVAAAGVVVVGLGLGGISPLVRAIPPELDGIGPALTGTAIGLVFAVGEAGGFVGPVALGLLYDLTGSYAPGLGVLAAGGLVVIAAGAAMEP